MAGTTLQAKFPKSFREDIDSFWGLADTEITKYKDKVFNVITDTSDRYTVQNRTGLGLPRQRGEKEPIHVDAPSENYQTIFDPQGFGIQVSFSYEFTKRDKTMVVQETLTEQRTVMEDACEYAAVSVFDSAASAGVQEWGQSKGNGVGLLSTAQKVAPGQPTQSNTTSVYRTPSTAAINSLIDRLRNAKNDVGLPRRLKPKGIFCHATRRTKFEQLTTAGLVAETSDNTPNVMGDHGIGKDGIYDNPYLSNRNLWGVLTDIPKSRGLIFINNIELDTFQDFDSTFLAMYHGAFQAVSAGYVDWRCFYGWA